MYCVLIAFSPKEQHATYFDSGRNFVKKNYQSLIAVMNDALAGYVTKGGPVNKKKYKRKTGGFIHQCQSPASRSGRTVQRMPTTLCL